jgi:peptidoglycan/LPS O-acetylase OafA/YrhL
MNELTRFILRLIPILGLLLVALLVMVLLATLGPALIPAAILAVLGFGIWIYVTQVKGGKQ